MSDEEHAGEFVIIADAAQHLGISLRQAQRDATKLRDTDKIRRDNGATFVRLSALAEVRSKRPSARGRIAGTATPVQHDATKTERVATMSRQGDATHQDSGAELIAELRATITRLEVSLEHERESHKRAETLHLGTMAELQEMRRRAAELEAQNAKLIEALPVPAQAPESPADGANEAQTGKESSQPAETPAAGTQGGGKGSPWWWPFGRKQEER